MNVMRCVLLCMLEAVEVARCTLKDWKLYIVWLLWLQNIYYGSFLVIVRHPPARTREILRNRP